MLLGGSREEYRPLDSPLDSDIDAVTGSVCAPPTPFRNA